MARKRCGQRNSRHPILTNRETTGINERAEQAEQKQDDQGDDQIAMAPSWAYESAPGRSGVVRPITISGLAPVNDHRCPVRMATDGGVVRRIPAAWRLRG